MFVGGFVLLAFFVLVALIIAIVLPIAVIVKLYSLCSKIEEYLDFKMREKSSDKQ